MITLIMIAVAIIIFFIKCEILTLLFILFVVLRFLYKIFSEAPKHF